MAANGYGIAAVFPRIEAIGALHGLAIGGILFLKRCTGFVRCHETDSAFVAGMNGAPASAGTFTNNLRANGSGSTSIDFTAIRADPLLSRTAQTSVYRQAARRWMSGALQH